VCGQAHKGQVSRSIRRMKVQVYHSRGQVGADCGKIMSIRVEKGPDAT
jgi:hypothetical protein